MASDGSSGGAWPSVAAVPLAPPLAHPTLSRPKNPHRAPPTRRPAPARVSAENSSASSSRSSAHSSQSGRGQRGSEVAMAAGSGGAEPRTRRFKLFGFGRKRDKKTGPVSTTATPQPAAAAATAAAAPTSPPAASGSEGVTFAGIASNSYIDGGSPFPSDDEFDGVDGNDGAPGEGNLTRAGTRHNKQGHRRVDPRTGEVSFKKVKSSDLMHAIQMGLRQAIGYTMQRRKRDLLISDFNEVESLYYPKEGSSTTPPHHYENFKFYTYAPLAYRHFRDAFDIDTADFLLSMCDKPMRELSNPGASGSLFWLSHDDVFIVKTVQKGEAKFLRKLLPGYYLNLMQNKRTLLPKFFGHFCYQSPTGRDIRFIVMNNLLPSHLTYYERYDLKGSTFGRLASPQELTKRSPTLKDLDFNRLHEIGLRMSNDTYEKLVNTIVRDCTVLESFKIMDYSLLMGLHNPARGDINSRRRVENPGSVSAHQMTVSKKPHANGDELEPEPDVAVVIEGFSKDLVFLNGSYAPRGHADANGRYRFVKKGQEGSQTKDIFLFFHTGEQAWLLSLDPTGIDTKARLNSTGTVPAGGGSEEDAWLVSRASSKDLQRDMAVTSIPIRSRLRSGTGKMQRRNSMTFQSVSEQIDTPEDENPEGGLVAYNESGERIYVFVGIIDVLQSYGGRKKLEHAYKAMVHDGDTVSVHRPSFYRKRFQEYFESRVFRPMDTPGSEPGSGNNSRSASRKSMSFRPSHSRRGLRSESGEAAASAPAAGVSLDHSHAESATDPGPIQPLGVMLSEERADTSPRLARRSQASPQSPRRASSQSQSQGDSSPQTRRSPRTPHKILVASAASTDSDEAAEEAKPVATHEDKSTAIESPNMRELRQGAVRSSLNRSETALSPPQAKAQARDVPPTSPGGRFTTVTLQDPSTVAATEAAAAAQHDTDTGNDVFSPSPGTETETPSASATTTHVPVTETTAPEEQRTADGSAAPAATAAARLAEEARKEDEVRAAQATAEALQAEQDDAAQRSQAALDARKTAEATAARAAINAAQAQADAQETAERAEGARTEAATLAAEENRKAERAAAAVAEEIAKSAEKAQAAQRTAEAQHAEAKAETHKAAAAETTAARKAADLSGSREADSAPRNESDNATVTESGVETHEAAQVEQAAAHAERAVKEAEERRQADVAAAAAQQAQAETLSAQRAARSVAGEDTQLQTESKPPVASAPESAEAEQQAPPVQPEAGAEETEQAAAVEETPVASETAQETPVASEPAQETPAGAETEPAILPTTDSVALPSGATRTADVNEEEQEDLTSLPFGVPPVPKATPPEPVTAAGMDAVDVGAQDDDHDDAPPREATPPLPTSQPP